jgi:Kef-type K+ transport system membrane component KefB
MELIVQYWDSFTNLFGHHVIFSTGLLLITGYFLGKVANKIGLPSITGYIVSGLLLGESIAGIVHKEMAFQLTSVTEIALGLIALTIGAEFNIDTLKRTGPKVILITFFEALFAFVIVTFVLTLFGIEIKYALILGAISAATAPAATVIIVRELRARGLFVDYLYGIVAFDDSLCVILFSLVFAIVSPMLVGTEMIHGNPVLHGLTHALSEILFSCIVGFSGGLFLHMLIRKKNEINEILIISVAIIFLTTAAAIILHLSLLIANMVFGALLVNLSIKNKRIFHILEPITPPIFALFFILAGSELNINVFTKGTVILLGLVYLLSRFAGKYLGTYISTSLVKAPLRIRKYLGFCLFPQAGVAIGLVLFVQTSPVLSAAPEMVKDTLLLIVNIILFSIFINELVGPSISRYGITKGAEL